MLESSRDALSHWQLLNREYIAVSIDRVIDHQLHSSLFERRIPERDEKNVKTKEKKKCKKKRKNVKKERKKNDKNVSLINYDS